MMLCNMLLILVFTVFIYDFCFQISGRDHSMAFACGRTKRHACKCRKSHDVRFLLFAIWFWPVEFMLNVFLCFFFSILLYQAKGIRGQTHDLTNSRATCIFATSNMNECAVVTANQKPKEEKNAEYEQFNAEERGKIEHSNTVNRSNYLSTIRHDLHNNLV